jgi:hypothetical protein
MRMAFFRAYGAVVLLLDLPLLASAITEICFTPHRTSRWDIRCLVVFGFASLVGIGLLFLRKWAALYFSITLFCFGLWMFLTSIEPIRFPWNLFYMADGISLTLPFFVTVRFWSRLAWGGKWFF